MIWTLFSSTCCRLHLLPVAGPGFPLPVGVPSGAHEPGRRHLSAGLRRRPPRTHGESHLDPRRQVAGIHRPTISEPVFWNLLRSPGIDFQPGLPVRQLYLSYRPARLHRLANSIPPNRFLVSLVFTNTGSGFPHNKWFCHFLKFLHFSRFVTIVRKIPSPSPNLSITKGYRE